MLPAYRRQLKNVRKELARLLPARDQIVARIDWLQGEMARLERLTGEDQSVSLAEVIQRVVERGGLTAGLTDSCRRVLQASERPLRANEVVLVLEKCEFATSRYVDPLAVVTTVMHRLVNRGQARIAETSAGGWPLFAWVGWQGAGEQPARPPQQRNLKQHTARRADLG